jgi:hypothetical protein
MRSETEKVSCELVERLKLLIFFHLGADANCRFSSNAGGLELSVKHVRTRPFTIRIDAEEFSDFAKAPEKIEQLFLDQLVENRRG